MMNENEAIMKDNRDLTECTTMMEMKAEEFVAKHHTKKEKWVFR